MIIYAVAAGGVSVGRLFLAGIIPGILLGLATMILCFIIAKEKLPEGRKNIFYSGNKNNLEITSWYRNYSYNHGRRSDRNVYRNRICSYRSVICIYCNLLCLS